MTYSWSPAVKEPLESDVFTEKLDDFLNNWVVSGLACTGVATTTITIASGTCYISGWRVETTGETYDTSVIGDGSYYLYLELTRTGSKLTSIDEAHYGSIQTETDKMVLCYFTIAGGSGSISAITDIHRLDAIDADMVFLFMNNTTGTVTSLSDWQHGTDTTLIDGAQIYAGSVTDTQLATISWSKISKTGSNLNEIATRSHTVLSDIGSNSHATIDSHISDTADPHGSTMGVSVQLETPRIEHASQIVVESTGAGVQLRADSGSGIDFSSSGVTVDVTVECDGDDGGLFSDAHDSGGVGSTSIAWRRVVGWFVYDKDATLTSFSERRDLTDLRAIKELYHPDTGEPVRGSWGDPLWDSSTLPHYIRSKKTYDTEEKRKNNKGFISGGKWKGWTISLLKKLDEEDVRQDGELEELREMLYLIQARLEAIGA